MTVTKQVYTIAATWTPAQHADVVKQAFVDAGLMTDWHDSFLSGSIENRVMQVIYNPAKTYGTTYYWFMFDTSTVRVSISTGWDTSAHVPSGTIYLDFPNSTTSNASSHHSAVSGRSTTVTNEIIRYTSQANSNFSIFLHRQGTTFSIFTIPLPSYQPASWIDLDKVMFHHFLEFSPSTSGTAGNMLFLSRGAVRRSYAVGQALTSDTNARAAYILPLFSYAALGKGSSISINSQYGPTNSTTIPSNGSICLPIGESTGNPAYGEDSNPVYNGMPISPYLSDYTVPSDFGIIPHYATNTMAPLDKFVVTAGVEEWEILTCSNNGTANTGASIAFAARIV